MWLEHRFLDHRFFDIAWPFEIKSLSGAAADGDPDRRPLRKPRPTPGTRILRAVLELAGREAVLVSHAERPWASVTFSGSRQTFVLRFHGWEACDGAEHLIAALPEHEFTLPGLLVADAMVLRTDQVLLPCPHMEVELEILLLDDQ